MTSRLLPVEDDKQNFRLGPHDRHLVVFGDFVLEKGSFISRNFKRGQLLDANELLFSTGSKFLSSMNRCLKQYSPELRRDPQDRQPVESQAAKRNMPQFSDRFTLSPIGSACLISFNAKVFDQGRRCSAVVLSAVLRHELAKVAVLREHVREFSEVPLFVLCFLSCHFRWVAVTPGTLVYDVGLLKARLGFVVAGSLACRVLPFPDMDRFSDTDDLCVRLGRSELFGVRATDNFICRDHRLKQVKEYEHVSNASLVCETGGSLMLVQLGNRLPIFEALFVASTYLSPCSGKPPTERKTSTSDS